ncbi:DUF4153 domain-containing protein [Eubacterium sp. MSJ-21]|nr:DUF4153 domain-containing protein [Eubacterium sp. MSJ-21]
MGKVSNYINQNMAKFKQIYIRYAASIFCALVIAIVMIIDGQWKGFNPEKIIFVCSVWIAGNILVESLWKKTAEETRKNKKKWLSGYGVTCLIAIVFQIAADKFATGNVEKRDVTNLIFENILYFYIACTVLLAVYVLIRQQRLDMPHCIGRILFALLRAAGVYLVLNIAVILIVEIIDSLLFHMKVWRVETYIQLLLSALAYFPTCLLAVSDTSEDNAAFTKKFVSYVLLPCVWIAMFVIYLYVVKIFVKQEVPSNEIFSICASLFAIGMPIWMMASGFVEEKTSRYAKLISITKYIYAPFILLEIYSMSVRVIAYGLTEQRYAAWMFILLQIIYILWEKIYARYARLAGRKKTYNNQVDTGDTGTEHANEINQMKTQINWHYENLILFLVGFLFVGLLFPFGNAQYLSYQSQKNRFVKNQTSDKKVAAEAYDYLRGNAYGRRYIKTNLTEAEQDELHSMMYGGDTHDSEQWESVYFYADPIEEKGIIIDGYAKIYTMTAHWNEESTIENYENKTITVGDSEYKNVDFTSCISYYKNLEYKRENQEINEKDIVYEIQISDTEKLIITYISFEIDEKQDKINRMFMKGYMLTK